MQPEHPLRPTEYHCLCLQNLTAEEVQQVTGLQLDEHFDLEAKDRWPGLNLTGGVWAVLQRRNNFGDAHGPRRLALLHVSAEAVWLYGQLWTSRRSKPHGVLLQDHGFGCNWCNFGGETSPLFDLAQQACLPEWLLVAENTDVWPGYEEQDLVQPGGMHRHLRRLYRLQ